MHHTRKHVHNLIKKPDEINHDNIAIIISVLNYDKNIFQMKNLPKMNPSIIYIFEEYGLEATFFLLICYLYQNDYLKAIHTINRLLKSKISKYYEKNLESLKIFLEGLQYTINNESIYQVMSKFYEKKNLEFVDIFRYSNNIIMDWYHTSEKRENEDLRSPLENIIQKLLENENNFIRK